MRNVLKGVERLGSSRHAGQEIILGEEEISDVSLATFFVFDKENPGTLRPRLRLGRGCENGSSQPARGSREPI
jgi:hypothetical protein